jgi:hypothetical protein
VPDAGDNHTTVVLVVEDGSEVILDVDARRADLALVDALMRLQLTARRRGWTVALRGATTDLRDLLALVGLADVLVLDPPLGRRGEPCREAELGEQLGVDEVVQPGDPTG